MVAVLRRSLAYALGALVLAGCVATVEERPARVVYVAGPPPAPLVEIQGGAPAPGMLWIGGYWHWNGVKYVWIPGHFESAPAGQAWAAPTYELEGGRYVYRAGRWHAVGARALAQPTPH